MPLLAWCPYVNLALESYDFVLMARLQESSGSIHQRCAEAAISSVENRCGMGLATSESPSSRD